MINLKGIAVALGTSLVANASANADVTLINVFEVPEGQREVTIAAWEKARDFLATQPGYITTALHQNLQPDARFQLINIAQWSSPNEFQAAIKNMRQAGIYLKNEGLGINPSLYKVVRKD